MSSCLQEGTGNEEDGEFKALRIRRAPCDLQTVRIAVAGLVYSTKVSNNFSSRPSSATSAETRSSGAHGGCAAV